MLVILIVWLGFVAITDYLYRHVAAGPIPMCLRHLSGYYIPLVTFAWFLVIWCVLYAILDRFAPWRLVMKKRQQRQQIKALAAFAKTVDDPLAHIRLFM